VIFANSSSAVMTGKIFEVKAADDIISLIFSKSLKYFDFVSRKDGRAELFFVGRIVETIEDVFQHIFAI
jgi:hypothetical protein